MHRAAALAVLVAATIAPIVGAARAEPIARGPFAADSLAVERFAGRLVIETAERDTIGVWIDGPDDRVAEIETVARGGTLRVRDTLRTSRSNAIVTQNSVIVSGTGTTQVIVGSANTAPAETVTIRVSLPATTPLDLAGLVGKVSIADMVAPVEIELLSGSVDAGAVRDCRIDVRGAGTIEIARAEGAHLDMRLHGSGSIEVADGDVDALRAAISGSGSLHFGGHAREASVDIAGVGSATIGPVDERPRISVSGVGQVSVANW